MKEATPAERTDHCDAGDDRGTVTTSSLSAYLIGVWQISTRELTIRP
jgi:hypothetical protein